MEIKTEFEIAYNYKKTNGDNPTDQKKWVSYDDYKELEERYDELLLDYKAQGEYIN